MALDFANEAQAPWRNSAELRNHPSLFPEHNNQWFAPRHQRNDR
jgi:hypothetical protein